MRIQWTQQREAKAAAQQQQQLRHQQALHRRANAAAAAAIPNVGSHMSLHAATGPGMFAAAGPHHLDPMLGPQGHFGIG